jgi:hypothetical protein
LFPQLKAVWAIPFMPGLLQLRLSEGVAINSDAIVSQKGRLMKQICFSILLAAVFLGCNKPTPAPQPPLAMQAVKAAVLDQLSERFPDHSVQIKQTDVHGDLSYTVHVTITHEGTEAVHPMKLTKYVDEKNPQRIYSGQIPISLFGERNSKGETFFQVYLDAPDTNSSTTSRISR